MDKRIGRVPPNKIEMQQWQKDFVRNNFKTMTNEEIAAKTGLSKTYVRMWAYSEGLQRELIVNWTKDQLDYFFENWRTTGNKEMADYINANLPSKKVFKRSTISKKMELLGLYRTPKETFEIRERNRLNGIWGNPQENKTLVKIESKYVQVNSKLRIELKPGQTPEMVLQKYSRYTNF
jgi:hypothetical protein